MRFAGLADFHPCSMVWVDQKVFSMLYVKECRACEQVGTALLTKLVKIQSGGRTLGSRKC